MSVTTTIASRTMRPDYDGCRFPDLPPPATPVGASRKAGGIRLSWPKSGDKRRAVLGKSPSTINKRKKRDGGDNVSDGRIVVVSHRDIERHYHFTSSIPDMLTRPMLDVPLAYSSKKERVSIDVLFQYFQQVAANSLTTFGYAPTELGNVLIRIAIATDTPSAKAVRSAMLAFSALHRNRLSVQAAELKLSAINALVAVSGGDIGPAEAVQHAAAGMLLCSFEARLHFADAGAAPIHESSSTSGQWVCYFRGVKHLLNSSGLDTLLPNRDVAVLQDWVYYHDVLLRFSLRHWYRDATGKPMLTWSGVECVPDSLPVTVRVEPSQTAPPAYQLIHHLSEICDLFFQKPTGIKPGAQCENLRSILNMLEWRIRSATPATTAGGGGVDDCSDATLILELYQLALLVYLNRTSENMLNMASRTRQQIDRAFAIFAQLRSCDRQFPVFILGCEARSDEERAVVLALIDQTEKGVSSRSFDYVRTLLQAMWAQDDLADGGIEYWDKMSYVVSCCKIVPVFV